MHTLALALSVLFALQLRAVDDAPLRPLAPDGIANVLVFVASDCPISNGYAPEIQRICRAHEQDGVNCTLIYEDPQISRDAVTAHMRDFRYSGMRGAIDTGSELARQLHIDVTPSVAIVNHAGDVVYRGRIDNKYETIGRQRRVVSEHDLLLALDAITAGRPVGRATTNAVGCTIGGRQ
jgi:hypothetical protein